MYMGRREGVVVNDGLSHGLFGKIDHNHGGNFGDINNISATADYVKKKVEAGTYLYDNVISIAKADFMRLGYDGQNAWRQLAEDNVHKMAEKVGILPSKLEYVAALHIDKGKPNFHILFWSKDQGIKPRFNYKKTFGGIRSNLVKYVYEDDLRHLSRIKTLARDAMVGETDDYFKDFFQPIHTMKPGEYRKMVEDIDSDPALVRGKLLDRNIPNAVLDDFAMKIIQLKEKLPRKGRLSYGFLPPDLKKETADIIRELLNTNPDFKREFDEYKNIHRDIASYYSTNPDALKRAEQKAEEDIIQRMSNKLLQSVKDFNREWDNNTYQRAAQRNASINLMSSLFRILTRSNNSAAQKSKRLPSSSTERIEARRDMRKQLEHSSSWGQGQ